MNSERYTNGDAGQNGATVPGQTGKKPEDKQHLVNDQDVPPKYDSADVEGENGTDDGKDPDKTKKEKPPRVGTLQLFRFATGWDKFLIFLGILCSIINGVSYPLMVTIFARAVEAFVNFGKFNRLLWRTPEFLATRNLTWYDARKDIEGFEPLCPALRDFYNNTEQKSCDILDDDFEDVFDEMEKLSTFYFIGGFVISLAAFGQIYLFVYTAQRQVIRMRLAFYKNIMRQEMAWFDANSCGAMTVKLTDDITRIHEAIGDKLGTAIQYLSGSILGTAIIFYYGWELALVMQIGAPLLILSFATMGVVFTNMAAQERQAYARAGSVAEEVFSSIRTVQAFNGQEKESERYLKTLSDAKDYGIKKSMASGFGMGASWGIILSTLGLGFWYGGKLVRDGDYEVHEMMAVFMVALIGCQCLGLALPAVMTINNGRGAAYGVYAIIDRVSAIDSFSEEGLKPETLTGNISLKGVHFTYPSRPDVKILKGLDLTVPTGQTVALVGQSGCGKSTVVQLLMRFYDPDAGQVCLDGVDIREINTRWLRQNVGIVGQEPVLFATTIAENIKYGREGATMDDVITACKNANAYDFIMKMPDGFDTHVGERGAQLSGGQKQRIAIARALVKNPKILLLDEATSALDTESEAIVQDALDKASKGRTTIIIAHRLSTIKHSDSIVVFDNGQVAEKGTHDILMAKKGIYFDLVSTQEKAAQEANDPTREKTVGMKSELAVVGANRQRRKSSARPSLMEKAPVEPNVWWRVFKLNKPEWLFVFLGCVASFANGAMQPIWSLVLAEAIEAFSHESKSHQKDKMRTLSLYSLGIGMANFLTYFLQDYMFGISGETLTMRVRGMLFKAMARQNIAWFDDPDHETGILSSHLAMEASLVQGTVRGSIGYALLCMGNLGIGLLLSFIYSWQLALVVAAFIPIILIGYILVTKLLSGADAEGMKMLEEISKEAMESIDNIRTVSALTKEQKIYEIFRDKMWRDFKVNMKSKLNVCLVSGFTQGISYWAFGACFLYGSKLLKKDELSMGDIFRVLGCVVFCSMQLGRSLAFAPDFSKAGKAASFIFNLHDKIPPIDAYSKKGEKPSQGSFTATVKFKGCHFRYPMRPDVKVLNGLDLSVEPGQTLALVGESGCGKSTCVQLIERFYDPESGEVSLDKYRLKDLNIQWLRSQIGLVSQEPILFDQSIAENIAYGDNSRTVSMDEIIQAAKSANIHNFIQSLPSGYDTNVGSKGTQLSGGQKQRVAIARALIRNPKILLLDEATSALDNESEKIVQEALDKARAGRTCITIAHRLTTIKDADKIAVFKDGVVHEIGTHDTLMAKQGLYYKLQGAQRH
ncbi:multidrug resistance protein 1 [Plakobranchus ocellatus]|uniref:Multidrug resistance protein 1 n=1 Tax=Plakobranchus ocellatus TaxID=259542 RepID=A0AAV4B729_9GAST|nr:multidrug resistance protein 1 [Plakobranchus ocellatus]